MFFIQTEFKEKCSACEDIFEAIDKKMAFYGSLILNNYKYGFNKKVDYDTIDDLLTYKAILKIKLDCDNCLCNYSLPLIISKIKKLTNTIC